MREVAAAKKLAMLPRGNISRVHGVESRVRPDAGFGTFAVRAPLRLQGDVLNQLRHVGGAADRLLTIQDRDPCSPSFGSFHYAYWRDKTSDFADVRFQEAGAMLGLLSLPAFDALREAEGWPSRQSLMAAFRAGLANLAERAISRGLLRRVVQGRARLCRHRLHHDRLRAGGASAR